jgi:hypothetical protein
MRKIDELTPGTYDVEILREGLRSDALGQGARERDVQLAREAGGARYRLLRVISTGEELLDTSRETEHSPGARFRVKVRGTRDLSFARL